MAALKAGVLRIEHARKDECANDNERIDDDETNQHIISPILRVVTLSRRRGRAFASSVIIAGVCAS